MSIRGGAFPYVITGDAIYLISEKELLLVVGAILLLYI